MRNFNFSSQRQAIYNAICSTNTHPSAKWVYKTLKPSYPNLSLGTVYRNISLFKEQGIVIPIANVDGEERIDGNMQPHAHFICNNCNEIFDIFDENIINLSESVNNDGFKVENSSVNFFGTCKNCD